jgi:hypothetical protein
MQFYKEQNRREDFNLNLEHLSRGVFSKRHPPPVETIGWNTELRNVLLQHPFCW